MAKRIRVLVVDDSIVFRTAITRGLAKDPQIEIVASAFNTHDARDKIMQTNPDVITLDVEMPGMSGIEFLKILMPQRPIPVIVVSAVDGIVFEAMNAGAVDFIAKPEPGGQEAFMRELAGKIKVAAVARLREPGAATAAAAVQTNATQNASLSVNPDTVVAIGASTGGTEATGQILKALPADFPAILITQHMPPVFTRMYAERLNREGKLNVSEAKDGEAVRSGHAYVAPGDRQMMLVRRGGVYFIKLAGTQKVSGHCPSVNVLFDSVAEAAGKNALGVILTGMGADGALGLLHMREAGAYTIGQDQQSCVVYGMPMEAHKLGAVVRQSPLSMIPSILINQLKLRERVR
ncbi:chemotaxis response regulator protein-glutamate methylesterase [Eubacteriales bacterium OttesenSCG-928-K08]|nr:chemotaxis response regulator protein-glutamate methylesterase [Eubacteriales bacterium OttesenSCG-928-K08]